MSLFTGLIPGYKIYRGNYMATSIYFYYLLIAFISIYFLDNSSARFNSQFIR